MFHVPERYRVTVGPLKTKAGTATHGAFYFNHKGETLRCIASQGEGWEHVSISLENRIPTWEEMCLVKDLFWDSEDTVVQYHPKKSEYVNCHPNVLHLWKPMDREIELPPSWMVGPK